MKLLTSVILLSLLYVISARIKDHYCGNYNCYTLLNVSKEATQPEIKKAYKAQSLKYHPDRNRDKDTTAIYREINRAYEVLNNEDLRKVYDEYLANPNANEYYQYYQFYKAVYAPKLDPRLVVGLVLSLVSVFQYFTRRYMYQSAISQIQRTTKFQTLVNQRFEEEKAAKSGMDKDDIIKELTETVRVHGGYSAPKIKDLLICKTILLPYNILKWIYDQIRWVVLFWILKRPYGEKEKEYLTRTRLGLNETRWIMLPEEQKEHFLKLELWVKENLVKYMKQMEEQRREMMANSTKYKQYQRYLKNKKK